MAYVIPGLVAETGTLSSGVVTVSGALTTPYNYRTFTSVLDDGDTISVVVADGDGDQAYYPNATWAESGGTLTLGSADFSTGTVGDGSVTVWAATNTLGGHRDQLLFGVSLSNRVSPITTGQKTIFDVPMSCVLTRVYLCCAVAPTGSAIQYDVEDEGTTLLNAVLSISTSGYNTETSTFTGSASSYALTKGDQLSVDCDQDDSNDAAREVSIFFFGYPT